MLRNQLVKVIKSNAHFVSSIYTIGLLLLDHEVLCQIKGKTLLEDVLLCLDQNGFNVQPWDQRK